MQPCLIGSALLQPRFGETLFLSWKDLREQLRLLSAFSLKTCAVLTAASGIENNVTFFTPSFIAARRSRTRVTLGVTFKIEKKKKRLLADLSL